MEVSNSDIMAVRPIIVQHGSADTVVRAMNVKYRKLRLGGPVTPKSLNRFPKNLIGISDHIDHPTPHAKFSNNRFKGGVAAHARNTPLSVYFFLFFSLRTATDQPVGPTDAANGSNEAS